MFVIFVVPQFFQYIFGFFICYAFKCNTFFNNFEYNEFNEVSVKIDLKFLKKTTLLELYFTATGEVNVNCDLTNEPYNQPISDEYKLVVKFYELLDTNNFYFNCFF